MDNTLTDPVKNISVGKMPVEAAILGSSERFRRRHRSCFSVVRTDV